MVVLATYLVAKTSLVPKPKDINMPSAKRLTFENLVKAHNQLTNASFAIQDVDKRIVRQIEALKTRIESIMRKVQP